jgi:DNA excision repair protein ERCC-2
MPTGTGKTVSLLSLFLSYLCQYPDRYTKVKTFLFEKLIYCTRTVAEMEKTLEELKFVIEMRKKEINDDFKVF